HTRKKPDGGRIMDIRTDQPKLRPIIAAAALLGLALTFASWPAAAQQWTPQQRAACEPDAMRLCQQYISDIGRVRSCMSHYRRYLSPACRAWRAYAGGSRPRSSPDGRQAEARLRTRIVFFHYELMMLARHICFCGALRSETIASG